MKTLSEINFDICDVIDELWNILDDDVDDKISYKTSEIIFARVGDVVPAIDTTLVDIIKESFRLEQ